MEITGIQVIPAPCDVVWNALNSPEVLKKCLPGCESVVLVSPDEFRVTIVAAIGAMRARFNGILRITEAKPNQSCVIVFEGQGGVMGFGKGSSSVTLRATPEGTELSYSAQAQVGGKLAQIGSRLIDSVAKKMSDDFFKALLKQLAPVEVASPVAAASGPEAAHAQARPGTASPKDLARAGALPALPAAHTSGPIMVPGWWLGVAVVLGCATTLAGKLLAG